MPNPASQSESLPSSPVYTQLTPVQLLNHDGHQIDIKVPYDGQNNEFGIDFPNNQNSEAESVSVEEKTEFQELFDKLKELFKGLPREMFVNRVLLNEASCEATLEQHRSILFEELKEVEDFPYGLQCELKRRVRTRNGDTVAVKLAYDIYALMAVFEGAEYSEIKDMLRSNKSLRSQSGTFNATMNPCEFSTEIKELTQNMTTIRAELLTMKQKMVGIESSRSSELQTVKATVLSLKSDLTCLATTVEKAVVDIKLAVERLELDSSLGVVSLKSELRVVKQTVNDLQDSVESLSSLSSPGSRSSAPKKQSSSSRKPKTKSSTPSAGVWGAPATTSTGTAATHSLTSNTGDIQRNNDSEMHVNENANRGLQSELQPDLHDVEGIDHHINSDLNEQFGDETAPHPNINTVSFSASPSFNATGQLTAEPLGLNTVSTFTSSSTTGITCRQSQLYSHIADKTGSNTNVTPANPAPRMVYSEQQRNTHFSIVNAHYMVPGSDAMQSPRSLGAQQSSYTRSSSQAVHTGNTADTSSTPNGSKIPVHYTGNVQRPGLIGTTEEIEEIEDFVDNDNDFLQYVKKKPKRFYLGGFRPEVTPDVICKYVKRRGPTVTWLRIWPSKWSPNNVIIRINVEDDEFADRLLSPTFWPRGVRCRPWVDRRGGYSDRRATNRSNFDRQLYGRADVDDYNPFSPLRNELNID